MRPRWGREVGEILLSAGSRWSPAVTTSCVPFRDIIQLIFLFSCHHLFLSKISSAIFLAKVLAILRRCRRYCSTSSGEVQKHTSKMMDWGVRWSMARRLCGVCDSDLIERRGISSVCAVMWANRDAMRSSRSVALSDTIVSVPRALGLE